MYQAQNMNQVHNPAVPYNAPIPGGIFPGRVIQVHGFIPPSSQKFAVNLLCGGTGDIALHVSPHFHSGHVARNSVQHMSWGVEERHGGFPLHAGQVFTIMILCEPHAYKIALNGQHFTEFHHRLPYNSVSGLAIDGQVTVSLISYEGGASASGAPLGGVGASVGGFAPPVHHGPAAPYQPPYGSGPYPTGASPYPPAGAAHYPAPGVGASPYPTQPGVPAYGVHQPGYPAPGYPVQPGYPATHAQQGTPYPHSPTGHKKTGLLDKAGMAVAGALGASSLMGGHGHKYNKLGVLGGGAAAGGLGAVLATGHLNPKKAMKKQAKAHKKALKYGLPIAGAGIGAYALHKGMHKLGGHHHGHHGHHSHSSSSSSSSSD